MPPVCQTASAVLLTWVLCHFHIGKIHLRMLLHELLENLLFLHFVRGWLVHGFLALIKHHFFNRLPCVSIEVIKFGVLRFHLPICTRTVAQCM